MKRLPYPLLLIVVMMLLLWWRLPDYFTLGQQRFIEPWGDGYKAYHAIFYHVQYDSTYSHFEGMNYPYGEHVVPGACQPLLSNSLKVLKDVGLDFQRYQPDLLHYFLLLGLVLCALLLYLIFVRLKLPPWYSALVAIGLTFLAPQIDRLGAHYGLAHPELLPIIFYLLLRWNEKMQWQWALAIGGVVWAYSLVHFYYFAIVSFAIFGWVGVRWLLQRDWKATLLYLGHGILMLGLPLMFFFLWMLYPDPITDRNPVPWGFFEYNSRRSGIFSDLSQPHWQWFQEHISSFDAAGIEGRSYIGLVAMLFLLYPVFRILRGRFMDWPVPAENSGEKFLNYLLISGTLILLFAFGLPFTLSYGEKLLKYAGPIQQFRSIGRFAWVFYYAVNICAFYYLFQWVKHKQLNWQKGLLLMLPLSLLLFESYNYNWKKNLALDEVENWEENEYFTDRPVDYSQYQACIPIPYFNIGSDNFWWAAKGWISQKPHTLSLQTGLPLTSAMLTRTSLQQTLNQLQLVTEPYRQPKIFADYPNDKPLLLFWDDARVKEYGNRFIHLNQRAKALYINDWLHLYELPLESFQCRIVDQVNKVKAETDSMYLLQDGWLSTDSTLQWWQETYDDTPVADAYRGAGELVGHMSYWNRLVDTVWQTSYTGELTISFWHFLNSDRAARTTIAWAEYDPETGTELFRQERSTHQSIAVFDDQGWGLVEFSLPRQRPDSRIELIVRNDDMKDGPLRIDELLIRPAGENLAQRRPDGIWWNNRWYPNEVGQDSACK
ncbi:MAG: hypothetical protein AAFP77_26635 [Bacteroidota bacterium]